MLLALSGGVDSSVAAALLQRAVGDQLTCIFVDHGLLRKDEGDMVEQVFKKEFDMNIIRVNAADRFFSKLSGVTDPERKRKIIGEEFVRVFEAESEKLGKMDFLCQGTIYPDVVESGTGQAAVIKSHHNVGGLPDYVDFKEIIEPLRMLFKDEVRQLGRELGLPEYLVMRQPFPGPGLAVRIIGEITREKLTLLQDAEDEPFVRQFAAAYAARDRMALLRILLPMEKAKREQLLPALQQLRACICGALAQRGGLDAASESAAQIVASRSGSELMQASDSIQIAIDALMANASAGAVVGYLTMKLR